MSNFLTKTVSEVKTDIGTDSRLMNLPIMKHFGADDLKLNDSKDLKPGAKVIYNVIALALIIATLYGLAVYVLPAVFIAIGKILAIGVTIASIIFAYLARKPIIDLLKGFARNLHKAVIKQDPFFALENAKKKMLENKRNFQLAQSKISQLKNQMESDAANSEKEAKTLQNKIVSALSKSKSLKEKKEALIAAQGVGIKDTDEYVTMDKEWMLATSDGNRLQNKYDQAKDFTIKFGARAAVMGKLDRKLVLVGTSIDIKVDDFDATVDILKKDYEFARKSREATESAKDAMLFTKEWEVDYALDVVTSTIAFDIANTAANLKDIDNYTANYAVDSDELYANLEKVANKISLGEDKVPSATKYKNPDYKLTTEDKVKSGNLESIF